MNCIVSISLPIGLDISIFMEHELLFAKAIKWIVLSFNDLAKSHVPTPKCTVYLWSKLNFEKHFVQLIPKCSIIRLTFSASIEYIDKPFHRSKMKQHKSWHLHFNSTFRPFNCDNLPFWYMKYSFFLIHFGVHEVDLSNTKAIIRVNSHFSTNRFKITSLMTIFEFFYKKLIENWHLTSQNILRSSPEWKFNRSIFASYL